MIKLEKVRDGAECILCHVTPETSNKLPAGLLSVDQNVPSRILLMHRHPAPIMNANDDLVFPLPRTSLT